VIRFESVRRLLPVKGRRTMQLHVWTCTVCAVRSAPFTSETEARKDAIRHPFHPKETHA